MEGSDSEMARGREAEWSGRGGEGKLMRGGRTVTSTSLSNDCSQHPTYIQLQARNEVHSTLST